MRYREKTDGPLSRWEGEIVQIIISLPEDYSPPCNQYFPVGLRVLEFSTHTIDSTNCMLTTIFRIEMYIISRFFTQPLLPILCLSPILFNDYSNIP